MNPLSSFDVIAIPPGTRLIAYVLQGKEVHVWIAVGRRDDDYKKWRGTYLRYEPSGRVTRVTVDDAYATDIELVIREGD